MKKTYINPNIEVVKLNMHQQMLSGSPAAALDPDSSADPGSIEGRYDEYDW